MSDGNSVSGFKQKVMEAEFDQSFGPDGQRISTTNHRELVAAWSKLPQKAKDALTRGVELAAPATAREKEREGSLLDRRGFIPGSYFQKVVTLIQQKASYDTLVNELANTELDNRFSIMTDAYPSEPAINRTNLSDRAKEVLAELRDGHARFRDEYSKGIGIANEIMNKGGTVLDQRFGLDRVGSARDMGFKIAELMSKLNNDNPEAIRLGLNRLLRAEAEASPVVEDHPEGDPGDPGDPGEAGETGRSDNRGTPGSGRPHPDGPGPSEPRDPSR